MDDEVTLTATVDGASFDVHHQAGQPDQTTFALAVDHPRIDPAARSPATKPADPPVRDLADLVSAVPAWVMPPAADGWTDAKVDAANRALAARDGGAVRLTLEVKEVAKQNANGAATYEVTGFDGSATATTDTVVLDCTDAAADFAARLNVGQRQTVVVTANAAYVLSADSVQRGDGVRRTARLVLTVGKGQVVR